MDAGLKTDKQGKVRNCLSLCTLATNSLFLKLLSYLHDERYWDISFGLSDILPNKK